MKISRLIEKLEYECLSGNIETEITTLCYDTRKLEKGSIFVCIDGTKFDAHKVIPEAVNLGAVAVVVQKEVELPEGVTVIRVEDTRYALACMSAAYFDYPAEKLTTIGITGTKGKTTTTYMVKSILENAGYKTGLIGTIEILIGDKAISAVNTTPESYQVQKYLSEMVEAGLDSVVMEVSSQGLMLHRVAGMVFDYGVFTNLSKDHIGENEHKDLADYIACKSLLFKQCKHGIFNADDERLSDMLKGHTCTVETYGLSESADLRADHIHLWKEDGNLGVRYEAHGLLEMDVVLDIPGTFSVYNSLVALAICRHFKVGEEDIKKALLTVKVKGRAEMLNVSNRYTMIIDYAHNAMSLESFLTTLKEYHPKRLVCLFGCGGNRSKDRRFEMGEISAKYADLTVVTSDNPRFEQPEDIIADIIVGVKRGGGDYISIVDRIEAIRYCMEHAEDGDVIVLAGKGHEDYQEICGVKHEMDERKIVAAIKEELNSSEKNNF